MPRECQGLEFSFFVSPTRPNDKFTRNPRREETAARSIFRATGSRNKERHLKWPHM